jgi:hypothetical protein
VPASTSIRARLLKEPQRFAEQALKHSECPTAINGGLLGKVAARPTLSGTRSRRLQPSVLRCLSEVIESELGYHLIRCEAIQHERLLSFAGSPQYHPRIPRRTTAQPSARRRGSGHCAGLAPALDPAPGRQFARPILWWR